MSRSDVYRLADMIMAADEISAIVQRGRDAFDTDVVLRRAVERCLEIIGKASKAMSSDVTDTYPEIPWSDMAKVRDRLSHHYHQIEPGSRVVRVHAKVYAVVHAEYERANRSGDSPRAEAARQRARDNRRRNRGARGTAPSTGSHR